MGWTYLRLLSPATRPGDRECAVSASATRLLPRRSGWSYWTAHAWCDRRLPARSRALHHIHDRSANTSIARHDIANERADFRQKPPRMVSTAAFYWEVAVQRLSCHNLRNRSAHA